MHEGSTCHVVSFEKNWPLTLVCSLYVIMLTSSDESIEGDTIPGIM